jgi:putative peptide zinc metalloprotease protein
MWIHDLAYKVIMVSGIGVTLLNLNPLIKLDGYYMFSEIIGEVDLKERSTLFVSEWVRKNIFFLPVEVEYVPRRRRILYIVYSTLSGIYGYLLIILVVLFLYHVLRSYTPEFAWIPGLLIAYLVFRSRIRKLVRLMKDIYLDKKDRLKEWFTPARTLAVSAIALIVLLAPVWPDFVEGRFVLEPVQRAVIRAEVPGVVTQVLVAENQPIRQGETLVKLRNLQLESEAAEVEADLQEASARATDASLHYSDLGRAEHEEERVAERNRVLAGQLARLDLISPLTGTVVTPRLQDLVGSYLRVGTPIAEIADLHTLRARVFIPEFGIRDVRIGTRARLQLQSRLMPISGTLVSIAPVSSVIDPALTEKAELNGIVPPPFYVGSVNLPNDGSLREGMTGTAKLFTRRRSPAEMIWRFSRDLIERRLW